ncbi:MAG: PD40 domain-containing protein [Bryobacterales bacterium]|nr:PD40 domain-containing protein [Bryobacterales bacterium]
MYRSQLLPPQGGKFDLANGFALSPDGRTLAFVATAAGQSGIWLHPMDGTAARLLPGTERGSLPFWSPDGRSLAYWTSGKLWRVDATGGSPIAICDAAAFIGGDWSPDGYIVFSAGGSGLRRVPASGGTPEALTTLDASRGETLHLHPQLLPGGRILFQVLANPEHAGIHAMSLANPRERVRLLATSGPGMYAGGHLFWLRGRTLLAQRFDPETFTLSGERAAIADPVGMGALGRIFAAASATGLLVHGRVGGAQFSWVDRAGNAVVSGRSTLGEPDRYSPFRLSPNGRRVAVGRTSSNGTDLWMADVEQDTWSRFTFLPGFANFPVWSPDARLVMFRTGSPPNLYRKEASGAGTEQRVTESANRQRPTDWSRDGRLVLYDEIAPETQQDLWILPVTPDGIPETGAKGRPYLRTRFNERDARFSPEPSPRWVAYTSDESGRNEVYVQAFPEPRGKFQISTGGGQYPEWSPDGRALYYLSVNGALMAAGLQLGADSVTPSTSRELFTVAAAAFQPYSVAPDGRRFLVLTPAGGSQPLEVVANWQALLKKRASGE